MTKLHTIIRKAVRFAKETPEFSSRVRQWGTPTTVAAWYIGVSDITSKADPSVIHKPIAAALFMYHVLNGDVEVRTKLGSSYSAIDLENLEHLRKPQTPNQKIMWDDGGLWRVYDLSTGTRKVAVGYDAIINDIGRHPDIVDKWGKPITYDLVVSNSPTRRRHEPTRAVSGRRDVSTSGLADCDPVAVAHIELP